MTRGGIDISEIALLGIPFNGDGTPPTEENPAAAIRNAGLVGSLRSHGIGVRDYGDIDIPPFEGSRDPKTHVLNLTAWIETSRAAAEKFLRIGPGREFLVVLGGDCSILLGIFGAFSLDRTDVGLVFLDGHTDYREPATSQTGEPADIELAVLTGRGPERLVRMFEDKPLVSEVKVIAFGFLEPDHIAQSEIRCFDRSTMAEIGVSGSVSEGLAFLDRSHPLWLHFDVDALDPTVMPVNFPEEDGLSLEEVEDFLSTCLSQRRCVGLSVACYHPTLDPNGTAARQLVSLLSSVLSEGT